MWLTFVLWMLKTKHPSIHISRHKQTTLNTVLSKKKWKLNKLNGECNTKWIFNKLTTETELTATVTIDKCLLHTM